MNNVTNPHARRNLLIGLGISLCSLLALALYIGAIRSRETSLDSISATKPNKTDRDEIPPRPRVESSVAVPEETKVEKEPRSTVEETLASVPLVDSPEVVERKRRTAELLNGALQSDKSTPSRTAVDLIERMLFCLNGHSRWPDRPIEGYWFVENFLFRPNSETVGEELTRLVEILAAEPIDSSERTKIAEIFSQASTEVNTTARQVDEEMSLVQRHDLGHPDFDRAEEIRREEFLVTYSNMLEKLNETLSDAQHRAFFDLMNGFNFDIPIEVSPK